MSDTKPQFSENAHTLASFTAYCKAQPTMRFWQALACWAGARFVKVEFADQPELVDTWPWRGRQG